MEPLKQSIKLRNLWFHLEDLLPSDTTYVKIVSAGACLPEGFQTSGHAHRVTGACQVAGEFEALVKRMAASG